MKGQCVVVSTTFYKSISELRFKLATEMVKGARQDGYRTILVDGSPDPEVRKTFEDMGAEIFPQSRPGMGFSRRQLFEVAFNATKPKDVIVWIEPEKADFIRFIPKVTEPILRGECDISIPVRTEASWQTYPKFQWGSERVANRVFQETTGLQADMMFGPVALANLVLPEFFSCFPAEYGIGDNYIQHVASIVALRKGAKVLSPGVEVDFVYPPRQKEEEDGPLFRQMVEKRLWQLDELVDAYLKLGKLSF